jgi:hypothetical protein
MGLTADRNTQMKDAELVPVKMAVAKIFAGGLTAINASGYATPGAASATLTYFGRAEETVDNTGGSVGDKTVLVRRGKAFKWGNYASDAVTQAEVGKPCYIYDDAQVAKTSGDGARSVAGIVLGVDADGVWVGEATRSDLTVAAALDFASIAAAASADLTIAVPGAAVGDAVSLGLPAAPTAGLVFNAFVSAVNTVTVRATNISAAPVDAASATYRATVHKA